MNIVWTKHARDRMADVYTKLPLDGQREFVRFIERTEARLRAGPQFLGESRATAQERVWCTGYLSVVFRLTPHEGLLVIHVGPLKHGAVNDDDPG